MKKNSEEQANKLLDMIAPMVAKQLSDSLVGNEDFRNDVARSIGFYLAETLVNDEQFMKIVESNLVIDFGTVEDKDG